MKRRDFLISSAGMIGAGLPLVAKSQGKPCPPPSISVAGGTSATAECVSSDLKADWIARSTGPGVVWAHDFSLDPDAFRKYIFYSPSANPDAEKLTVLDTSDGILGGGCLMERVPAGQSQNNVWARPFSPFPGDRGYVDGDAREFKAIVAQDLSGNSYYWRKGLYGHSAHWSETKMPGSNTTAWEWIRHKVGFYIQFRCKISASYFSTALANNEGRGKLTYTDLLGGGSGELVQVAPYAGSYWNNLATTTNKRYSAYTNWGGKSGSWLLTSDGKHQPGGAWDATCLYGSGPNTCWEYPADEWFTILLYVNPGRQNPNGADRQDSWMAAAPYKDTVVRAWAHRKGESGYRLITEQTAFPWHYNATYESNSGNGSGPPAFNSFNIRPYMGPNNLASEVEWTRRWDQIIFSTELIPCPVA